MLFLLRNIRRKLMTNLPAGKAGNKVTTYLLYAIGEIVLVVAGILIAVQIDDWNQGKKTTKNISVGVDFMLEELRKDSLSIANEINRNKPNAIQNISWLQRIDQPLATFDTVLHIMQNEYEGFWTTHFKYNDTSYANMKSSGSFDLLPDSIKSKIHDVYERLDKRSKDVDDLSIQYRTPMEEYNKRYTMSKDTSNISFKIAWANIDPQHFVPRARWLVFTRNILFDQYVIYLGEHEQNVNELIIILYQYKTKLSN